MEQASLRVLMISSDRLILAPGSAVSERMREYGALVGELHIVLLSDISHGLKNTKLGSNVWVYPTNSSNKFLRPFDAVRIGKKISADLITTQDPFECGWAGLKLRQKKSIPLEVQLHTDLFSDQFSGFLNIVRKRIARKVLKYADAVRVVRSGLAKRLKEELKIGESKIAVLPIYIDRRRFSGEPKFDLHSRGFKYVILTISRLSPEKNLQTIIGVMAKVADACLVIVGSGPERVKLERLADKLGLKDRVFFDGWQEDLSSYYQTADIFVQASSFEGYGLSLVEAGLSGLPVISTPVGIASDIEDIIRAKDEESFAERINYLLSHKEEGQRLAQNVRKTLEAETYTKEAFLNKLLENWQKTAQLRPK